MRVLCISGKRFAGKDTLARLMVEAAQRRGIALATYAFAAECKRMFAARHPEVDLARLLDDRDYKEAWRPQLTQFTVESLAEDPLVFVREVMKRIDGPSLITDLRLRLELDHLKPYVLRITRSDANRTAAGWRYDAAKDTHHTETELDDPALWDEQVPNDGSIGELEGRATELVGRLLR
jgi:phosphomevalonate kinase